MAVLNRSSRKEKNLGNSAPQINSPVHQTLRNGENIPDRNTLNRCLPSLLDEACERNPNPTALNDWHQGKWRSLSTEKFRVVIEEFACGLLALDLTQGDRVAMLMHSDLDFCIADVGCLLAGFVTVPIDLTQTPENITFILKETQAKVLLTSTTQILHRIHTIFPNCPHLRILGCAEVDEVHCTEIDEFSENENLEGYTFQTIITLGQSRQTPELIQAIKMMIVPQDIATIVYIASSTQQPRGVVLTHENISSNILSAFASHPTLNRGSHEVALSFLPLTHIFARAFFFGHLNYGHSLYFSSPHRVINHLQTVRPTIFITIPRLLEKIYVHLVKAHLLRTNKTDKTAQKKGKGWKFGTIGKVEKGRKIEKIEKPVIPDLHFLSSLHLRFQLPTFSKVTSRIYTWALDLAHHYECGRSPKNLYALQLKLVDHIVFRRWREIFGGRIKSLICGGAALNPVIANVFTAAGIPVLQGYGLTETSSVVAYTRGIWNRAGTVGHPIPGVNITIAPDGEILIKSPYVMKGYFNDPEATHQAFDSDGWFHTGDLGTFSSDGFLTITGVKKPLFKLATGKYVAADSLEQQVERSPFVDHAIALGANQRFCTMLIAPNLETLNHHMQDWGYILSPEMLLHHPCTIALYQSIIDDANCHLPYWSAVQKFRLMNAIPTLENGMMTLEGLMNRAVVIKAFHQEIDEMYSIHHTTPSTCPHISPSSCPATAKSLMHF